MCTTTTHYETHISTECSTGGTGQCDGYCNEHGTECTCGCHRDWFGDMPTTVPAMRDWHDQQENVVASFEKGDQTEQWSEATNAVELLNKVNAPKQYKVLAGQGRTVVAERYV
jgi:hypothetical protein